MTAEASVAEQVNDLLCSMTDVATLIDSALRDELVACDRAAQMLLARQADVMAEMGRRASTADRSEEQRLGRPLASDESRAESVADEVGATLTQTRVAATHRYSVAVEASRYPTVMAAWRSGTLDLRRVETITDALKDVQPVFADSFAEAALTYAATHTAPQLRQWLARRVVAADPAAAEVRKA